ncbi:hypothetical protein K402DRAFT_380136 [Aulographum hederae CBS 113979]|uniref:Uncharacterized protein n=1 Tax=Aulographum hederae CBS 113979 TaxID=1176131 RepID=A0A6G1GVR2_9PEZI|nr:hypothetical protein K402DRAFT_380136 [Aulographum hederae CBS 113979]
MSVTTTSNPLTHEIQHLLVDYELHHSPSPATATAPRTFQPPNPNPTNEHTNNNPPNWPTTHRRVPPFRPVDVQRDQTSRRTYISGAERAFITMMFFGIRVSWNTHDVWRATGGKINDRIFRYKIGGEW